MKQQRIDEVITNARRTHNAGYQYLYKAKTSRSNARLKRFMFKALRKFEAANKEYLSAYVYYQKKDDGAADSILREMNDSHKELYILLDSIHDD